MNTSKPKPPAAGKGRRPGTPNKTTSLLKEAILLAAEEVGQDGKGKGGLTGYLKRVAEKDTKSFASLLGRVLPLQITGANGGALTLEHLVLQSLAKPSDEPGGGG